MKGCDGPNLKTMVIVTPVKMINRKSGEKKVSLEKFRRRL
jgi:hypothetical protein